MPSLCGLYFSLLALLSLAGFCAMGADKRRDRRRPIRGCSLPPQRTLFMRKSPGKRASQALSLIHI